MIMNSLIRMVFGNGDERDLTVLAPQSLHNASEQTPHGFRAVTVYILPIESDGHKKIESVFSADV